MKNLYLDTRINDKAVREELDLSEELMMENAASALEEQVKKHCYKDPPFYIDRPNVLVLCGSGNNGADGYALARRLICHSLSVTVCSFGDSKTSMCILQKKRAVKSGVNIIEAFELDDYLERISVDLTVVVDCIFGTGFHGELPYEEAAVIEEINNTDSYKIACDVPSGLDKWGNSHGVVFKADTTVSMGALKVSLYSDSAKDFTGDIVVASLGIDRDNYEYYGGKEEAKLLERKDLLLPYRTKFNVHKGSFGHVAVISGDKKGAGIIASCAALKFGCGLVTLCSKEEINAPYEIMQSTSIPDNVKAVALGMGLGRDDSAKETADSVFDFLLKEDKVSCVLDADVFYLERIKDFLCQKSRTRSNVILTPHPKEFSALLKNTGLGDFSIQEVIDNRITLVKKFCSIYEGVVLILKGANVVIAYKQKNKSEVDVYINPLGSPALAKAGSGDVLSGMCVSLLAQGCPGINAAVYASLVHAVSSSVIKNNYALTPFTLIDCIANLDITSCNVKS